MLDKSFGAPTITKDGVSVAKEIELEDKSTLPEMSVNAGLKSFKRVANSDRLRILLGTHKLISVDFEEESSTYFVYAEGSKSEEEAEQACRMVVKLNGDGTLTWPKGVTCED